MDIKKKEIFDNIKKSLDYIEERDDDFLYLIHEKNYDKFTDTKMSKISEFYNNIYNLETSQNNKRKIIKQYIKNEFYDKINKDFSDLKKKPQKLKKYNITNKAIDNIALNNKWWTKDSKRRYKIYGIIILEDLFNNEGHIYVTQYELESYINININNNKYDINTKMVMNIIGGKEYKKYRDDNNICISNGGKISLKKYKDSELNLEENINRIKNIKYDIEDLTLNDFKYICPRDKMLSDEQLLAINMSRKNFISAVIGKGGTGKTSSVVKYLCKYITLFEQQKTIFITPTHAAKNRGKDELSDEGEMITIEYGTIHSYSFEYIKKNEDNNSVGYYSDSSSDSSDEWTSKLMEAVDSGSKYIIVDEMSMVDLKIFNTFIEICSYYNDLHIILLGDNNQLYPVGIGCPFRDLIEFDIIEKTELTKNYRSDGDIVPLCEEILTQDNKWTFDHNNENSLTRKYNKQITYNFTNTHKETNKQLEGLIKELKNQGYIPYSYNKDKENTFQIITFKNDDCVEYSKFVRNLYNGNHNNNKKYEIGDHIIIKKNNTKKKYHNGDEGVIVEQTDKYEYKIKYKNCDGEESEIHLDEGEIKPALARTVHSSQGLQFPIVIYVCKSAYHLDMNINYTAYSRAKNKLYLIGNIDCFNSDRVRKKSKPRNTFTRLKILNSS